nr:methyltransferase domain-containing protein [Mesorhizobium sp.]
MADQVLEHVHRPLAAAQNIHAMTRPGGWAMVATPFLFRVHARPHDYKPLDSRRTEAGDGRRRLPGIRNRSVRLGQ